MAYRHKWRLVAGLLFQAGCFDAAISILTSLAQDGDPLASQLRAGLFAQTDRLAELRRDAAGGDVAATRQLGAIAAEYGWENELATLAVVDVFASCALAGFVAARGDVDGAADLLRPRADAGEPAALVRLAWLLFHAGRIDELRARTAAGDWECALRLVDALAAAGQPDEAVAQLRLAAEMRMRTCARTG